MRWFAFALLMGLIHAVPAVGQQIPCIERETALSHLETKYLETPRAVGLTAQGKVLEVWVAERTRTWTMLVTTPSGCTVIIGNGNGWEWLPAPVAEESS